MAGSDGTGAASPAVISRRDAIVGALALAAGTLIASSPEAAFAADGDKVTVGQTNTSTSTTLIVRMASTDPGAAMLGFAGFVTNGPDGAHYALHGDPGLSGTPGSAGVYGQANSPTQFGVLAVNQTVDGVGLKASAPGGKALVVDGPATFSRSGLATISKGHSGVTVKVLSGVASGALILATLQGSAGTGVYLRYAKRASATTFTVSLNKAAAAKVSVAWMILN